MTAPELIVFDLDDTLYLERDYVLSGLVSVGDWLLREHELDGFAAAAWRRFQSGCRGTIFDAALHDLGMMPTPRFIAELVDVYRHHVPLINLAADAAAWLAAHGGNAALALLTDGPCAAQSRKLAALGLDTGLFWPVVMADTWGTGYRKPHPRGFAHIQQAHGLPGRACAYVADNAAKDFITPSRLGWRTVQIRRPGGIHTAAPATPAHAADTVITSFAELTAALDPRFAARTNAPHRFAGD